MVEVALLGELPPSSRTAADGGITPPAPPARGRITTRGGGSTTATELPAAGTGERSRYLTMRGPGDEPLQGPSEGFTADFLNRSKQLPPPPDIPGERVGQEIADLRAEIKRTGRSSPGELEAKRIQLVRLNQEREAEELKPDGGGTYRTEKPTFRAKVHADGSVALEDKPQNMDLQDRMMLRRGIDPYGRNKLSYLDRTRDQRVAVGTRHRAQELGSSVIYMQQHIVRLWATTTDEATRKRALFELWDECLEVGTVAQVEGGEAARAFVMAHIRANVTYTTDELRALNAQRQSQQAFAP